MTTSVYNSTQRKRELNAARDLALKLRLETKLKGEIKTFFRRVWKTAKTVYTDNHQRLDVSVFDYMLRSILKKHYNRVLFAFQPALTENLNTAFNKTKAKVDVDKISLLSILNKRFVDEQSQLSARQILSVTQKDMDDGFTLTIAKVFEGGRIEEYSIIAQVEDLVLDKTLGRAATISITETQKAAEAGKMNVISAEKPTLQADAYKEWQTILDGRQRESHDEADGQQQMLASPFVVQGQALMYPGDNSMGASLDNIINCRCSVQYFFKY